MSEEKNKPKFLEGAVDRVVRLVSPEAGMRRMLARERLASAEKYFGYDAATPGTRRGFSGGRGKNASSESSRMSRDRIALMWDARDLVRNFAILRGVCARVVQYVADTVQYVSQTGDDGVDDAYQSYFHSWCERCDVTERHRLGDLVWMMMWALLVDGDHGWNIVEVETPSDGKRLRIQPVEADRIGNPNDMESGIKDALYFSGVRIDEVGRVVEWDIYERNRETKQYKLEAKVPAEQFIHVFNPDRVDQYRGVTALATALAPARDLYEAFSFEMQAAKWQGGHAGFVRQAAAGGGFDEWTKEGKSSGEPRTYEMQPGRITRLMSPGEDVIFAPGSNRPSGAFMALVQVLVREIAQGLNMPYGFIYDMTAFSGHTGRVEIGQANRGIRRWQKLIEERALLPLRDLVLGRAIAMGELPPHDGWRLGKFGWGRTLSGDYGHDTQANISLMNMGILTATDLISETGSSFEDVVRRQASEVMFMQKVAGETGVPIELMTQRVPGATQQLAAAQAPPEPPSMIREGMDVKPLVELAKQVGEGVIDREAAAAQVVAMYGVNREDALVLVGEGKEGKEGKIEN